MYHLVVITGKRPWSRRGHMTRPGSSGHMTRLEWWQGLYFIDSSYFLISGIEHLRRCQLCNRIYKSEERQTTTWTKKQQTKYTTPIDLWATRIPFWLRHEISSPLRQDQQFLLHVWNTPCYLYQNALNSHWFNDCA